VKKIFSTLAVIVLFLGLGCSHQPEESQEDPLHYSVMPVKMIGRFQNQCAKILTEHPGGVSGLEMGREGWAYQISEIRYGASGPFYGKWAPMLYPEVPPEKADPVGAVVRFRDELASMGIELLVMPVPDRPVIYPEGVLDIGDYRDAAILPDIKPIQSRFIDLLGRAGINAIDLGPYFLADRRGEHGPLFCKSDPHWAPSGTVRAAEISGDFIKKLPWYNEVFEQHKVSGAEALDQWMSKNFIGHCVKKLQRFDKAMDFSPEVIQYRKIAFPGRKPGKTSQERLRHPEAPITVFGDSNTLRWNELYASYPQELEFETGLPIDTISTSGGGINEARMSFVRESRQNTEYLKGKKLVIWVFTIRAVLEAKPCWIDTPLAAAVP